MRGGQKRALVFVLGLDNEVLRAGIAQGANEDQREDDDGGDAKLFGADDARDQHVARQGEHLAPDGGVERQLAPAPGDPGVLHLLCTVFNAATRSSPRSESVHAYDSGGESRPVAKRKPGKGPRHDGARTLSSAWPADRAQKVRRL